MLSSFRCVGLACGLLMAPCALADDAGDIANFDSVEVPAKSEHVVLDNAYISPSGHLVLQANGVDSGVLRVNFYDAQTGDWLLPTALTSQEEVRAQQIKLIQGGFTKLEHMPMITLANGTKIFNYMDFKNVCFGPYAIFMEMAPSGGPPAESAIYLKRKTPETIYAINDPTQGVRSKIAGHNCRSASGSIPALVSRYKQGSPFYFSDKAGGFFMLISRYAIHFDAAGNSAFFKGQSDPIYLSSENAQELKKILASADKKRNPQDAIDEADAFIGRVEKTQMEEGNEQ